ncbi:orotate phosphoribosyltransferase [Deinococcus roseus]|uniref:Orotate phosphoribosyltransferase n=1 Tax=Deinococcus roseus TaxID=392414 RepID=A0ABQ2CV65_9DEIO|nr:orotate phosphoribosyltransferase [Deinococcus roseus]GGJ24044.1 orotate phosphoribosyltransferase [Deinococcus roseus]
MDVLQTYKYYGAFHEGHFLLASGRHSPYFLQSTTVLQHPVAADQFGEDLGRHVRDAGWRPDFVIGPAMGGVVLAYVTARPMGTRAIFAEKDGQGGMKIREAFGESLSNQSFVAVEDVITTGGSVLKAVQAAEKMGAKCLGIACIIDRRKNPEDLLEGHKVVSLTQLYFDTYLPDSLPDWLSERPLQEI